MSTYQQYLTTLRRVPDDIVLATATREILPFESYACLCGWFVREQIARMAMKDAADVSEEESPLIVSGCRDAFGGEYLEWYAIFCRIGRDDQIEAAFVDRVLEAVES